MKGIKWRVGRKELEEEENFFSSSFSFKRFVFKRWKALIQAWFEFYLVKWIHFRWYIHDGSLKFVEWKFKLMVLCSLNDIHKHEIWSWDNDSIGRIEETIYPLHHWWVSAKTKRKEKGESNWWSCYVICMELCYYEYARYRWCMSWDNWKEKKQFIPNSATLKSLIDLNCLEWLLKIKIVVIFLIFYYVNDYIIV